MTTFVPPQPSETGLVAPEALARVSGLDFFRNAIERGGPLPPIAAVIPMRITEVEEGRVVFESEPTAGLMNPLGTVHGGYAMTLLDSCMGCAVHSTLDAGHAFTTVEAKVNFVRTIMPGVGLLRAEGAVVSRGRRIGLAEGRVTGADGKLYAHGTSTCLIISLEKNRDE